MLVTDSGAVLLASGVYSSPLSRHCLSGGAKRSHLRSIVRKRLTMDDLSARQRWWARCKVSLRS